MGNTAITTEPWPWRAILLIVIVGLLSHGLLLLTDYSVWDGIWEAHHLRMSPQDYDGFLGQWREGGRGYVVIYFELLRGLSHPEIVAKWLGVVAWLSAAVGLYLFLSKLPSVDKKLALGIVLVAVSLPFYDVLGDVNSLVYSMPVAQFWLGFAALEQSRINKTTRFSVAWVLLATFLLFLSFMLNSNLVLFYGVFSSWLLLNTWMLADGSARRRFVIRYSALFLLPIVFWAIKRSFYPTAAALQGWYNEPSMDAARILSVYLSAWRTLEGEMLQLSQMPIIAFFSLFVAIAWLLWFSRRSEPIKWTVSWPQILGLLLSGMLLALCAVFPYAAVGQELSSYGWLSRNAILLNIPVALCLGALLGGVSRLVGFLSTRAFWFMVVVVVSVGIGLNNANYLRFQALGAKQMAIIKDLGSKLESQPGVSVVQIRDYFLIPGTIEFYPPVIWSYLIARKGQLPSALCVDTRSMVDDQFQTGPDGQPMRVVPVVNLDRPTVEQIIASTTFDYAFRNLDEGGRQLLAVIMPRSADTSGVDIGLRYLFAKHLNPSSLNSLLSSLLECRIEEVSRVGS